MGQYANGPRIRSVNVGAIETLELDGKTYRTAFRKRPVADRVAVGRLGLGGDDQANRKVHGGPHQALYAYPHEHYAAWEEELGVSLDPPSFGENLIVDGLLESDVEIGDRLLIGSTILEVSQPRMPCSMLSVVHQRKDMTRLFGQTNRPGFYLRVVQPGEVQAGDPVERAASDSGGLGPGSVPSPPGEGLRWTSGRGHARPRDAWSGRPDTPRPSGCVPGHCWSLIGG